MRKILFSLMTLVLVIGMVGAGAFAYFSDTETSSGNTFTAGTLDLATPGTNPQTGFMMTTPTGTKTIELDNEAPGNSGQGYLTLNNVGSLAGELDIVFGTVTNLACDPHGRNDGSEYCDTSGDLGGEAEMAAYVDKNDNKTWDAGTDVGLNPSGNDTYYTTGNLVYATIDTWSGKSYMTGTGVTTLDEKNGTGDEAYFVIDWNIPGTVGNSIQGDGITFDVTFTLEQADKD